MWLSLSGILICAILFFGILSVVYWLSYSSTAYFGEDPDIYVLASNGSATVKQSKVPLALAPALTKMPGIDVVSPELFIYGIMNDRAVIIRGVLPQDFIRLQPLQILEGRWLQDSEVKGAVAGYNLARKLGLRVNDTYVLSGSEVDDFTEIKLVGIFQGRGMIDDDLLLNMKYARFLQEETREGYASIVRIKVNRTIWPSVASVWQAVSGPPTISNLSHHPDQPNNTEKVVLTCRATALNQIGSVVLLYRKSHSGLVNQKTMELVGPDTYQAEIGPVRDSPWVLAWAKAIDVLGHEKHAQALNISITDALGPDIYDVAVLPPPPQTKDDVLILSFMATDSSELVRNVTVHTYNAGRNESIALEESAGKLYRVELGKFQPGSLYIWVSARDRFGNLGQAGYYTYRILNRTDQSPPEIQEVLHEPTPPYDDSNITITVRIVDDSNITVAQVIYDYQVRGRHFNGTVDLSRTKAKDIWTAQTGPFPGGTDVYFKVYARDEFGNAGYSDPKKVRILYSEPPEIFDVYRFPFYPPPGTTNLLFMDLYDASEIETVNITYCDGKTCTNLSIPVEITTFREPLLLGPLSPGPKAYSVEMTDRRNQTTRTPESGLNTFTVSSLPPSLSRLAYPFQSPPGRSFRVSFLASSSFPLSHLYLTDSRGVIEFCNWTGSDYVAFLGPYSQPGTYSFVVTARDAAGNIHRSGEMLFTITDWIIQDLSFSPEAPLLGETLTVTCKISGDAPQNRVELVTPVGWRNTTTLMSYREGLREATIAIEQPGILPILVQVYHGNDVIRSQTYRIAVSEGGPSLLVTHDPAFPASSDDLVIRIRARDVESVRAVVLNWTNGTSYYRQVWITNVPEFSVDFRPGLQIGGYLSYRVTVFGTKTDLNVSLPPAKDDFQRIQYIPRNVFYPPEIVYYRLSPQSYIRLDGQTTDDYLVQAQALIRDERGILKAWIEYNVGGRTMTDPLLPSIGYAAISDYYLAYLGPYAVNQTITARIFATNLAGQTFSTPQFQYTLVDVTPPKISGVYHTPLEPSPRQEITIGCEVTDDSGVKEVILILSDARDEYRQRMNRYANTYTLEIPSPAANASISYRILATDNYGNSNETETRTIRTKDVSPPRILEVSHAPTQPTDTETVNITVVLIDYEDEVQNVTVYWYQYDWKEKTQEGGRGYLVRIFQIGASEFVPGMDVRYKVEAYDRSGNRAIFPSVPQEIRAAKESLGGLGQEAFEPYLTFKVLDITPPTLRLAAEPLEPNELQTVSFALGAADNHLLKNLTLQLLVDGVHRPYFREIGRPTFDDEFSSGALRPGGVITAYLEAFDQSGNYARYPPVGNLSIRVKLLEWGGQVAVRDPRVNLDVAGPAGFSEDMARQGAGKIIASINGILFMTFLATVAGIGNIVYTSIYRSKREIGILRTLGGSKKYITLLVGSLTALMGFLAGLMGCGISYLLMVAFSRMGASLAWVTLRPTLNLLILAATISASIVISLFGGLVALSRLFTFTPVESVRTLVPPAPKEQTPIYLETTKAFPLRTLAAFLVLVIAAGCLMRLYPTVISEQPFDPDSWLHLKAVHDLGTDHHLRLDYESRELQTVAALPGLNMVLLFVQRLTGQELAPARFITPLISGLGLLFVFVLARRLSGSAIVASVAALVLAFAGFYSNRTAALTKEALALQLLLFSLFVFYLCRQVRSVKSEAIAFLASVALILTHHLTAIYLILILCGYLALVNLGRYSKGNLDRLEARRDAIFLSAVLASYLVVGFTLGRYETKIPFQDALLILSLFFVTIGLGKLLLSSTFMDRHRRVLTLTFAAGMVAFPILAHRAGLFSYAPWEQVLPMLGPHLVLLALAVLSIFPVSLLPDSQQSFFLAWISAVMPFVFYGVVKRDVFGYILLFRNIAYGYQLAAVMAGVAVVYGYKRFQSDGASRSRRLVVGMLIIILACNIGMASHMGFLSQDYERKDLYHPREIRAALVANESSLRGNLVGSDERGRRLLLYITGEDGDQLTTYVYLIRMEKYLINRLRTQVEMTDRPLTHLFLYSDMYSVGFVDTVLFKKIDRPRLNRFEDVIFDDGNNQILYVARKDWP